MNVNLIDLCVGLYFYSNYGLLAGCLAYLGGMFIRIVTEAWLESRFKP